MMQKNLIDLSYIEMLSTIGGIDDKAVLNTACSIAALVASISLGQPVGIVYSCFEIGYNATKIFDD